MSRPTSRGRLKAVAVDFVRLENSPSTRKDNPVLPAMNPGSQSLQLPTPSRAQCGLRSRMGSSLLGFASITQDQSADSGVHPRRLIREKAFPDSLSPNPSYNKTNR